MDLMDIKDKIKLKNDKKIKSITNRLLSYRMSINNRR